MATIHTTIMPANEITELTAAAALDLTEAALPAGCRAFHSELTLAKLEAERAIAAKLGFGFMVDVVAIHGDDPGIDGAVIIARVMYSAS